MLVCAACEREERGECGGGAEMRRGVGVDVGDPAGRRGFRRGRGCVREFACGRWAWQLEGGRRGGKGWRRGLARVRRPMSNGDDSPNSSSSARSSCSASITVSSRPACTARFSFCDSVRPIATDAPAFTSPPAA